MFQKIYDIKTTVLKLQVIYMWQWNCCNAGH